MANAVWVMIAVLAVATAYIWGPYAVEVYRRVKRIRSLRCPETGKLTCVRISALRAGATAPWRGLPILRVIECERWPERAGCNQDCTAQAA